MTDAEKGMNHACGEDSDCINRATKMECVSDCSCGNECQNRRFQRKEYAEVTVFKTEKKGFGLRADTDMEPNQLIFEYIGEVIGEAQFERRLEQYDREKIKHFYFMSLNKGEFVDATKKGNLGRFCNHSCSPNCYVDKWVVGDRLRMGIFCERAIVAGEELTFNYNVDRYGAEPQACYCGEPNCTGYIGGKTQTERGTKLPAGTIEALGLEDGEDWDLAVARKPRKKKTGEFDEEYIDRVEPRSLDETAVNKVMATLMQCKEQWIAVKLLTRIQKTEDDRVKNRVVRMHGYRIFKQVLTTFAEDENIILQVLDVLHGLPRLTRNKIQDSNIEETVQGLTVKEDTRVVEQSQALLKIWDDLIVAYRIPRMKREAGAAERKIFDDRRRERSDSKNRQRSPSKSPPRGPANVPSGPKGKMPQRSGFAAQPRRMFSGPNRLPPGWFEARDANGKVYYYTKDGTTTWAKPTLPAASKIAVPPPPPSAPAKPEKTKEQMYQEIINSITASAADSRTRPSSNSTPKSGVSPAKAKEPKWKSYSEDKKMKVYENTIHPHIKHVTDKYHHKIPKDDIKKHARELCKKFVASDFKKGRVTDPTKIGKDQIKAIQSFVKEYFQKLLRKTRERKEAKAAKEARSGATADEPSNTPPGSPEADALANGDLDDDDELPNAISPDSPPEEPETPSGGTKRKHDGGDDEDVLLSPTSLKRVRSDVDLPTPPPPPPPPADADAPPTPADAANGTPAGDTDSTGAMDLDDAPPQRNGTPVRPHPRLREIQQDS